MAAISSTITVGRRFAFTNKLVILEVHCSEEDTRLISGLAEVKTVEPNVGVTIQQNCASQATNSELWGLSRLTSVDVPDYPTAQYEYLPSDGNDTYAYVIDSGIYVENVDFGGRAVRGYTVASLMESEGDDDLNGHGTHCAGTIMSSTYGVAKSATAVAVKVINQYGFTSTADLIDGLTWTHDDFLAKVMTQGDSYKAVASMSLGGGANSALDAAVQACIDAGLAFVVAGGGSNSDACNFSPSRIPDAITTAATDQNDNLVSSSNWGTCIDILAPGVQILSTWIGSPTATAVLSGTSMSTNHASGVLLRYMSQLGSRPSVSNLTNWLTSAATPDICNMNGQTTTPNLLLHAPCILTSADTQVHSMDSEIRSTRNEDQPSEDDTSLLDWQDMKWQIKATHNLVIAAVVMLIFTTVLSLIICSQSKKLKY